MTETRTPGPASEGAGPTTRTTEVPVAPPAAPADAEEAGRFDALSFDQWLSGLDAKSLKLLTGGGGGGGSSSGSSSSSKGGGVGGTMDRTIFNNADLLRGSEDVIDPSLLGELEQQVFMDLQDDQEARDAVNAAQDQNLAQMEADFERRRDANVTDLFGTGAEQSSIARRMTQETAFDQSMAEGQVRAQTLGLLADIEQQEEAKRMAAWTTVLGIQAQMDTAFIGANAAITGAQIGAEAQVKSASINASATVKAASINASATRAASQNNLLAAIYGIDVGQAQFDADLDFRYQELDTNAEIARDQMAMEKRIAAKNRKAAQTNAIIGAVGGILGGFAGKD